jgi:lambda repressor-like predicted transcriptional regulator
MNQEKIMTTKNWTGIQIKHELEKAGSTQAEIARELEISSTQVHRVLYQGQVSDRVRRRIAKKIGVPVERIWPEYYLRGALVQ